MLSYWWWSNDRNSDERRLQYFSLFWSNIFGSRQLAFLFFSSDFLGRRQLQQQHLVLNWHLRSHLICSARRETETIGFSFKTLPIDPFLHRQRLSLMSPNRGRWSIFNPRPAFIHAFVRLFVSRNVRIYCTMHWILTPLSPQCLILQTTKSSPPLPSPT